MAGTGERQTAVLVAAAGAGWEAEALRLLEQEAALTLHQRNVDVHDLLAAAATGLARCAVVADSLPGLDADTVARLTRCDVAVVAVLSPGRQEEDRDRLLRLGVVAVVGPDLSGLCTALRDAAREPGGRSPAGHESAVGRQDPQGRIVAVWGPAGAPGRTTVATSLAAECAARGRDAMLVDADPYGGAVAQHLGILDEVSGLLAAARRANAGRLGADGLNDVARVVDGGLRVVTGLPRADRWGEVRPGAFRALLDAAEELVEEVVVDVGFSLEAGPRDAFAAGPRRNETTLAAIERAADVVVVGSADPVGLSRLARGLVDLRDLAPGTAVHVVVNRTRATLGWSRTEVGAMIESFVGPLGIHYLPEDRPGVDRALSSGRSVVETAEPALRRGIAGLGDALWGAAAKPRRTLTRRWAQAPNNR